MARKRFNDALRAFNTTVRKFPTNLIAGFFGFESRDYFEAPVEARAVPAGEF